MSAFFTIYAYIDMVSIIGTHIDSKYLLTYYRDTQLTLFIDLFLDA